jgi:hypothetical protein
VVLIGNEPDTSHREKPAEETNGEGQKRTKEKKALENEKPCAMWD